jgi:formamidopyrimidine-DNA glycosylase
MPELPEVETVRLTLLKLVKNAKIIDIDYDYAPIIKMNPSTFVNRVKNQTIYDIKRYGKYLVFILDEDAMIMHMRMEGKFYIKKMNEKVVSHEHVIFTFSDGRQMRYHDVRKFGTIHLLDKQIYINRYPINRLGKEPKNLDPLDFYQLIHHRKTAIKNVLLNQHIISGLGNIYVDETLFLSGIHPKRRADKVTKKEATKLVMSARAVLEKAIALGGSTIRSYTSSLGVHGRFQNELNVHTKFGEPCPICQTSIVKMKVGGRTSYVCESCQK